LYTHLLTFDDPSLIGSKQVGEQIKVSPMSVASMIGQLKTNAKVYTQLMEAGYPPDAVSGWVFRPGKGDKDFVKGAKVSGGVLAMLKKSVENATL
jgi:hypothetical protein